MASWLPLGLGRRDPEEDKANDAASGEPKTPEVPRLSADEMRRRRLAKYEADQQAAAAAAASQQQEGGGLASPTAGGGGVSSSPMQQQTPPPTAPPARASSTPLSTATTPPAPPSRATSIGSSSKVVPPPAPNATALPKTGTPTSAAVQSPGGTSSSSGQAALLAAHRMIQRVFQVTTDSKEVGMHVLLTDLGLSMLTQEALSEVVHARLLIPPGAQATPAARVSGLSYLAAAYQRWEEEARSRRPLVTSALIDEVREILLNFSASCVTDPEVFGMEPGQVHDQLTRGLLAGAGDTSSASPPMPEAYLRTLMDRIEDSGGEGTVQSVFGPILSSLLTPLITAQLLSDPGVTAHVSAIRLLMLCHKSSPLIMVDGVANFLLPPEGVPMVTNSMFPMMRGPAVLQRNGLAHEKHTTLGLLFRLGMPAENPQVLSAYDNIRTKPRAEVENRTSAFRAQIVSHQAVLYDLVLTMLKGAGRSKTATIAWMAESLALNAEADKERPDPSKKSSNTFLFNLAAVLLRLSAPFIADPKKRATINPDYLPCAAEHRGAFPADATMLIPSSGTAMAVDPPQPPGGKEPFNFITQCFFLTWRALHLGLVQCIIHQNSLMRWLQRLQGQMNSGDERATENFNRVLQQKLAMDVQLLEPDFIKDSLTFLTGAASWLDSRWKASSSSSSVPNNDDDDEARKLCEVLPEHLVTDIVETASFLSNMSPRTLATTSLTDLFSFCVTVLSKPARIHSPHLRAKFGDVLYSVFLPPEERFDSGRHGADGPINSPHTSFLLTSPEAQTHLAPSLLLLYGDVEQTGYYDKLTHRIYIATVLKYLWKSPEHRSTFRRISKDTEGFVRFANGLMNETNTYVASVMKELVEIRGFEQQRADAASWAALTDQQRQDITERHQENERSVESHLLLCNETIHMVMYLTSDAAIRVPFLLPALRTRLANMLLSVLAQLVGSKGLEIKVENPDKYNFRPREMLHEVSCTILHFADKPDFHEALVESGYYRDGLLSKAYQTLKFKTRTLSDEQLNAFEKLSLAIEEAATRLKDDPSQSMDDIPEEFLDPVMYELMKDPVLVPTSNTVMDRHHIEQHLLNDQHDPFNRKPLTSDMLVPQPELKAAIQTWIKEQRDKNKQLAAAGGGGETSMT